jgi:DNA-binding NarL/FixJ family response regulator
VGAVKDYKTGARPLGSRDQKRINRRKRKTARKNRRKWDPEIPSEGLISRIIRRGHLRTGSELRELRKRTIQRTRTTRPLNRLTKRQRNLLLRIAEGWMEKNVSLDGRGFVSADDIRSGLLARFQYESERVPFDKGLSDEELTRQWTMWIKGGIRWYLGGIWREKSPRTIGGNFRRAVPVEDPDIVSSLQKRNRLSAPLIPLNISFHTRLTPTEEEVLGLVRKGKSVKRIASSRGVSVSAVRQAITGIRRKANREK